MIQNKILRYLKYTRCVYNSQKMAILSFIQLNVGKICSICDKFEIFLIWGGQWRWLDGGESGFSW